VDLVIPVQLEVPAQQVQQDLGVELVTQVQLELQERAVQQGLLVELVIPDQLELQEREVGQDQQEQRVTPDQQGPTVLQAPIISLQMQTQKGLAHLLLLTEELRMVESTITISLR
jgi:hypothetical protein